MATQVKLELIVDDKGSVTVKQFGQNSEEALNKVTSTAPKAASSLDTLKSSYLELAAKATTAYMGVMKAVEYMKEGAKALQQESSFRIMAESYGANADAIIAHMKAATRETIDDSAMMEKAVKMMTLGFDPSQIERFSGVVITASQIAGTTAPEAFDRLADAISTRMPRALVQMGAVTRDQMKVVTEAINSGAESTILFELAVANLELKQKMLQGTQDAATISMQRFHAQTEEAKETLGKGLLVVAQSLYGVFQSVGVAALELTGGIFKVIQGYDTLVSHLPGTDKMAWEQAATRWKIEAEAAFGAAGELAKRAEANMYHTAEVGKKATAQELADGQAKVNSLMKQMKAYSSTNKEAEALANSWNEMQMTLSAKIEGAGMSELTRQLIANQLEADKLIAKYGKIPGALKLIQEAHDAADRSAEIEAEKKALDAFEDRIKKETEEDKKLWNERQRLAKERLDAEQNLYKDLRGYEVDAYKASVRLIDTQAKKYRDFGIDEVAVAKWVSEETRKANIKKLESSDSFMDGVEAGYLEMQANALTFAKAGSEIFKTFAQESRTALSDGLFQAIKTQSLDAGKIFESFGDAMLKKFTDVIAQMIVEGATKQIVVSFGATWSEGAAAVLGAVGKVLGYAADWAFGDTGSSMVPTPGYAYGGLVPGYAFGGDAYSNDTVRARLSPGEYVVPRSTMAAIAGQGQQGDTMLAHINTQEAALLKALGGSGTINERTGLPQFYTLPQGYTPLPAGYSGPAYMGQGPQTEMFGEIGSLPIYSLTPFTYATNNPIVPFMEALPLQVHPGSTSWLEGVMQTGTKIVGVVLAAAIAREAGLAIGLGGTLATMGGGAAAGASSTMTTPGAKPGDVLLSAGIGAAAAYFGGQITGLNEMANSASAAGTDAYQSAISQGMSEAAAQASYDAVYQAALEYSITEALGSGVSSMVKNYLTKWAIGQALGAAFPAENGKLGISFDGMSGGPDLASLIPALTKNTGGDFAFSARDGLDYVPRDNFYVRAHEGEAVLTAKDAKDWRGNKSRGSNTNGDIIINLHATVTDAKTFKQFAKDIKRELDFIDRRSIRVN